MRQWKASLLSLLLLAALWLILSGGATASWVIGLPALALAAWAARRLRRPTPIRLSALGILRFLPLFLWESLRGGIDVAWRTLQPRMPIQADFFEYRSRLQNPAARTFLANCVSLLPGSLAADLQGEWLEIHVLNLNSIQTEELARLERAIAAIFNEEAKRP
jgi:multicomponent Na+:H+ antiporter subunit E